MTYEIMALFKNELVNLYSKERLKGYDSLAQHDENLNFIGIISPKIAKIEIALRNMLDFALGEARTEWLLQSKDEYLQDKISEIQKKKDSETPLSHHQILSRLTLGAVIRLIKENKLQNALFDLKDLDFRVYNEHNFHSLKKHRYKLRNYEIVNASLNLFLTLRNRCFHWENLRKTKQLGTITLPRIYTTIKGVFISLDYDKIESFLDDIGNNINENLLNR